MFYVYKTDKGFVQVKGLKLSITKSITSHWTNIGDAATWDRAIKKKYPTATLEEAILILKSDDINAKPF